jgi:amidophosphoribosyltransferase
MCGIIGLFSKNDAVSLAIPMLEASQNRGQEAFGILTYGGKKGEHFHSYRYPGLVNVDGATVARLTGKVAIGHVRYGTNGGNHDYNIQPFLGKTKFGGIGIAHNGNLLNTDLIRKKHLEEGSIYQSSSDTEAILHLITKSAKETFTECLIDALTQVKGAYSLVILRDNSHIIGVRDPRGFHPLSLGKKDGCYMLASETCVWNEIGAEFIREIEPGEMIDISESGFLSSFPFPKKPCSHCIFEQPYFSHPTSVVDGLLVSESRYRSGKVLEKECGIKYVLPEGISAEDIYLVSAVPDSAVGAAEGFAKQTGCLRAKRGIIKSRSHAFKGRTFIEPTEEARELAVRRKYCVDSGIVKGQKVILIDDSIVRGTTMRRLVQMVREAGALEVHIRIAFPPFKYRCLYGIDTPADEELIASKMSIEEMRKFFNADSLAFISLDGLRHALGEDCPIEQSRFCTACSSKIYPE